MKRVLKNSWKYLSAGVVLALIATVVLASMPTGVDVYQEGFLPGNVKQSDFLPGNVNQDGFLPGIVKKGGFLSLQSNIALAVGSLPTSEITSKAELVESTWMRTKNSKVFHSYGIPNKDYHDIYLDAVHYEVGYERDIWVDNVTQEAVYWTVWEGIDNTLEPVGELSPWDWQMVKADYNVYFLENFTYGQILKFEKATPHGEVLGDVTFQPMALQWTNDLDQVQEVSMPQSGTLLVVDNQIQWNDAYGSDIDFSWTCASTRLIKILTIDLLSNLPVPEQYILDGVNPVLRLDFIFDPDKDLDIFVDDVLWDEKSDTETFGTVEFRLEDEVLWGFTPLWVWDSSGSNELSVVQKLEKVGGKLFVSVRVPYEWIQNAVYPIYIDTVIDEWIETSSDDASELVADGSMDLTDTIIDLGSYTGGATHAGFRFTGVDTTNVEHVSTAYLEFYPAQSDSGVISYTWYGEDVASATTFTTNAFNISGKDRTTANVVEDSPVDWVSGTLVQTADLSDILSEIFERGDWVSGNDLVILNIYGSGSGERRLRSWDYNDHSKAPKLHFENITEVTYYFESYDEGGIEWTTTPEYAVDNILTNYASTTVNNQQEALLTNTCIGTDLGIITKVELRAYAYSDADDELYLIPVFDILVGDDYITVPGVTPDWGEYQDITSDEDAPSPWTWADIVSLKCMIELDDTSKGNTMHVAKVEIKVTYWSSPESDIDVGEAPIDRDSVLGDTLTCISKNNPANASGELHSIKIYANVNITGLRVGTFYTTNGNTLKCRDSEVPGDGTVEAGAERTIGGLSIAVEPDDYIGCYFASGEIDASGSGGAGVWYVDGENIDSNDEAEYTLGEWWAISLYGYGDAGNGVDISNAPNNNAFGTLVLNTTSSTAINKFTITNNSGAAVSVTIQATDFTGGDDTWDLSDDASVGENIYGLKAGLDDDDDNFDVVVKEDASYNTLVAGLVDSGTQDWGLKLYMPSSVADYDGQQMTATVTLVATLD